MTYMLVSERRAKEEVKVTKPSDCYEALKRYHRKRKEHFFVLTLNGAHHIHAIRIITIGLVNRTLIHSREVFIEAIKDNAAAVVIAHNHPSGNFEPSQEDNEITKRLKQAGEIIGIPVLDHLVFSHKGFYSFLEHGFL
jgi:DNA repair protein RadC